MSSEVGTEVPGEIGELTSRARLLRACGCEPVDRPPVWLMRQAGRALPEYMALKEKHSFLEMVRTPELATEVTLQPVRRFGFDAAILFSDILVIPEAMGQSYRFRDRGGIEMDFLLQTAADIDRLDEEAVFEKLQYVVEALRMLRGELGEEKALLGFAGSPWTLACFMLEGGSSKDYGRAKRLFYAEPKVFNRFCEKLTTAVTRFLGMQVEAGVDAVQIFDSLGGMLADNAFERASARWIREVVRGLEGKVPVIVFGKGVHGNWPALVETGAQILGVDWTVRLADVRAQLPANVGVQGNLDPTLLSTTPEIVAVETGRILEEMRGFPGHIFNLGHGVQPVANLDAIESLVTTVKEFK